MNNKLKVAYRKPLDLTGYENNARIHDDQQIEQIILSIEEFGFTNPILIDANGGIIAGHGRHMAAIQMDLATVPCIVLGNLTDEQKRAYVLADNKLALNARWDEQLLTAELSKLGEGDFTLMLTGFNEMELASRLDDAVDDAKKEWVDMPEFHQNSIEAFRTMIVHLKTEDDWAAFVEALALQGFTPTTKYVWWPFAERDNTKDLREVDTRSA